MAQIDNKKLHAAVIDAGNTLKELHRELVELTKGHTRKSSAG